MKKILVIGCPGAGKSTFASRMHSITKLPLCYLDMIWHRPDKTTRTYEEFDERLEKWLTRKSWIIDGNYLRTLERRIQACDTIFFLDFPLEVCLQGALSRIGKKRKDMPWVEEKLDDDFKQWILDFHKDQYPYMLSLLEKAQAVKEIYHFTSRKEADAYLDDLQKKITTLYFIRHAEADYHHKEERTRPLSEKGKRSCQQICDFFADQPLDAVYSSPYKRAVDTIQALADQKRLNIITLEALKERCISSEWIADYDTFVQKQWEDFSYKLSCGESLKEVQKRNISAVMEILDKHVGHQVIIGTHGTAFATILNYFDPAFGYEDFLKIKDLTPYLVAMTFDMHKWIGIQKKQFSNM